LLFPAKAFKGLKAIILVVTRGAVTGWHPSTPLAKARQRHSPRQQVGHAFSSADSRWQTKALKAINETDLLIALLSVFPVRGSVTTGCCGPGF
jgi:hypothetical protein